MINFSAEIYPNWLPRLKERVTKIFTSNITWSISSTLWRDKLWTNHTILSPQDHTCLHATLRLCVVKSKFSLSKLYKNNLCFYLDELKKVLKLLKGVWQKTNLSVYRLFKHMTNLEIERKIWKTALEKSFLIFTHNLHVTKLSSTPRKDWYSLKSIKNWKSYLNKVHIF